jgi:hypothetical protein
MAHIGDLLGVVHVTLDDADRAPRHRPAHVHVEPEFCANLCEHDHDDEVPRAPANARAVLT